MKRYLISLVIKKLEEHQETNGKKKRKKNLIMIIIIQMKQMRAFPCTASGTIKWYSHCMGSDSTSVCIYPPNNNSTSGHKHKPFDSSP